MKLHERILAATLLCACLLSAHTVRVEANGDWRLLVGQTYIDETESIGISVQRDLFSTRSFSVSLNSGYQRISEFNVVPLALSPRISFGIATWNIRPFLSASGGAGYAFDRLTAQVVEQTNQNFLTDFEISNAPLSTNQTIPRVTGVRLRFSLGSGIEVPINEKLNGIFEFGFVTQDMSNLIRYRPDRSLPGLRLPQGTQPNLNSIYTPDSWHTSYYISFGIAL